jgi:hypothetical protein
MIDNKTTMLLVMLMLLMLQESFLELTSLLLLLLLLCRLTVLLPLLHSKWIAVCAPDAVHLSWLFAHLLLVAGELPGHAQPDDEVQAADVDAWLQCVGAHQHVDLFGLIGWIHKVF